MKPNTDPFLTVALFMTERAKAKCKKLARSSKYDKQYCISAIHEDLGDIANCLQRMADGSINKDKEEVTT